MRFMANRTGNAVYFAPEGEGGGGGGSGNNPPPEPATWYGKAGVTAEHHEWLQGKQYADASTQIASHRALEAMVGRQRLAVPNDEKDVDAYNALYKTLGRPDKPDAYKLAEGSKISGDEWKNFAPIFHEAGLGQGQVDRILAAYEKRAIDLNTAAETERANEEGRQIAKLDGEWGSNNEANKDIASRAFRALGIDEAMSDKIEGAIGYYATMKLFHAIGSGMKEPAFHQDGQKGGKGGDAGTLQAAERQLKDKFKDEAFMTKYMHNDPRVRAAAIAEVEDIQKRIAQLKTGGGG